MLGLWPGGLTHPLPQTFTASVTVQSRRTVTVRSLHNHFAVRTLVYTRVSTQVYAQAGRRTRAAVRAPCAVEHEAGIRFRRHRTRRHHVLAIAPGRVRFFFYADGRSSLPLPPQPPQVPSAVAVGMHRRRDIRTPASAQFASRLLPLHSLAAREWVALSVVAAVTGHNTVLWPTGTDS